MNARRALVTALWLTGWLCRASSAAETPGKQDPPKLMLWSWFAEDDFRPLGDRGVGVAYLALSLELKAGTR